jgi:Domain of unknown function (DUF4167)
MQNGPKTMTSGYRPKSVRSFANRSKQWTSNGGHPELRGPQNAQRSFERYLALAQAQAQSGDVIGAENYYQHAEHYFRSMSSDRGTT